MTIGIPQAEADRNVEKKSDFLPLHWSHIWAYSDKTVAPIRKTPDHHHCKDFLNYVMSLQCFYSKYFGDTCKFKTGVRSVNEEQRQT